MVNRPLKILDTRITDFLSAGFYIGNALIMCFFESFVFRNANILVNCLEIVTMAKKQKGRIDIALYFCTIFELVPPLAQLLFAVSDALNQLNYTISRTCPQCEGRIVSTLDTNTRSKEFRRPKPNEQLRKLRPGMWRDEKQAATRMPGSKEAPAQKQGSYAPDGSGHDSQQPATAAKLQLRNSGFPKVKL